MNTQPQQEPNREYIESIFAQLDALTAERDNLINERNALEKELFAPWNKALENLNNPPPPAS